MNSTAGTRPDLVDYRGSVTALHGRYERAGQCICRACQAMQAAYLADPDGGSYAPDIRWVLADPATGAVVLHHVRPESFTRPDRIAVAS
jgi:hypothetical protein